MQLPVLSLTAPQLETGPRSIAAVKVLRISITDRCNFRCVYCMPAEGVAWLPKEDILSFDEIADVVRAAIEVHGIRRFKLTGGEPTVRHGLCDLVRTLRRILGIEDLSLTTNGVLLEDLAMPLKECGLDRVTISIDSLREDRFRKITRTGDLRAVLRGMDRAEEVGLLPLKINCVTMRGTNDDEFADFARLTLSRRVTVRFIEYMPLGDAALLTKVDPGLRESSCEEIEHRQTPASGIARSPRTNTPEDPDLRVSSDEFGPAGGCGAQDRGADAFISESEVRAFIEHELGPLVPIDRDTEAGVGPAVPYQLAHGNPLGRIGFISAMSQPFCSTCNRLRLTANGVLRSCLFEGGEVDIRSMVRAGLSPTDRTRAVAHAMAECVRLKPEVHTNHGNQQMSRIGG
jgi:GTP 3',8-cyclase